MKTTRNLPGSLQLGRLSLGHPAFGGLAFAALLGLLPPSAAQAQEQGGSGFTLGLFGLHGNTPYGFSDSAVLPFLEYENDYFKIGVPSLDVKLPWVSSEQLSFGLTVDFFGGEGGYEASDDPILHGMAERESSIWAGATALWQTEAVDLSFKAMGDIGGESDGTLVSLEASHSFHLGERFMITPKLGAVWLDDKTVDYYYGVRAAEVTADRAGYEGSSTVNIEAGISFGYMLTERQMLMLDITATKLGSGITDSPIVTEDRVTKVALGYMFRF